MRFELEGLAARVVQHELDHLDGVLIIDRTDAEHRKEALGQLRPQPVLRSSARSPSPRRLRSAPTCSSGSRPQHEIAYLLTRPDAPRGRGRRLAPPPAKEAAERLGIPVHQPERPELRDRAGRRDRRLRVRPARSRSRCSTQALWLNVHPSLLPRWRGAAPVERAILAGDEETGVTIHETVEALDAGPIAAQERFPIAPEDDAGAVFARAAEVAARLLDRGAAGAAFEPQPEDGVDLRREDRRRRPRARPRRPASTPGGACARSRRTSARGRRSHGRRVTIWRARARGRRVRPGRGAARGQAPDELRRVPPRRCA